MVLLISSLKTVASRVIPSRAATSSPCSSFCTPDCLFRTRDTNLMKTLQFLFFVTSYLAAHQDSHPAYKILIKPYLYPSKLQYLQIKSFPFTASGPWNSTLEETKGHPLRNQGVVGKTGRPKHKYIKSYYRAFKIPISRCTLGHERKLWAITEFSIKE